MADETAVVVPYLCFDGNTREAMEFYHSLLGGDLFMQTFKEAGMGGNPETDDQIIHSFLNAGDVKIMASETMPGQGYTVGDHSSICIISSDAEKQTAVFNALAEGGSVKMPLEKQFWGDHFGMVVDKFGQPWMINIGELK